MGEMSKEIRSEINSDGLLTLSISSSEIPKPKDHEVLIKVEASPINPSDLGLLISFAADVTSLKVEGEGDDKKATMNVHPKLLRTMQARLDKSMQVGNEGAGVVIDAGKDAKEMIGKTVGVAGGAMYSQYRCIPAQSCLVMHEGTSSKDAASSFVNPLTALGFIETMKMENHSSLVHTAAASNLGQMLIKICLADNATRGFDATGGGNEGKLAGQILSAMETAANRNMKEYSRYGSDTYKQVYIYGGLDPTPTVLNRSYGLNWGLGGWLLTPFIAKAGNEIFQKMRQRVADEITTTFASNYTKEVSLSEMLDADSILTYAKQATGEKYLVTPHK